MMLHCLKTGRFWPAASMGIAKQAARNLGLVDWMWCPETAPNPPTMAETTTKGCAP